jgi:mycothiol system anti-sigma-R factor
MTSKKKPDHYNCADVEKLAQQYLDNQLDEEQRRLFNEHLDYCLPCDKKIEFEKKLKEIVRLKTRDKAPVSLLKAKLSKMLNDLS